MRKAVLLLSVACYNEAKLKAAAGSTFSPQRTDLIRELPINVESGLSGRVLRSTSPGGGRIGPRSTLKPALLS